MSEVSETPQMHPSEAVARLEAAQKTSGHLAWGGLALAFLWWVAAIVGTIALVGAETLGQAEPALVIAGLIAIILPGLMLVLSGMMAREQARSTAANAVVLEAAARLLLPAFVLALSLPGRADTTIDSANKAAWSANAGWITLRPNRPLEPDGVVVNATYLSGFGWSANLGWINFGDGSPLVAGRNATIRSRPRR